MKKTLTKDITRYDDKMQLKFDMKTFRAIGISIAISAPIAILLYIMAGSIPAIMVAVFILAALIIVQCGKIKGLTLSSYIISIAIFAFCPKLKKKAYSRDQSSTCDRLVVLTDAEERRDKNAEEEKARRSRRKAES